MACGDSGRPSLHAEARDVLACEASAQTIVMLENTGDAPLEWSGTIGGVDGSLTPDHGVVGPRETANVQLSVPPMPIGDPVRATVTIASNDPVHPRTTLPVTIVRGGAKLAFDKASLDFGMMPAGVPPPTQMLALRNDGNELTTPTPITSDGFTLAWSKPTVAPGETITGTVGFSSAKLGVFTGTATIAAGNLCGSAPTVTLRAVNVEGVVGVSPGVADLGLVGCGATAPPPAKLTVFNASKQPFQVTASMVGTSLFEVSPSQGVVAGESHVELTVTMPSVPQTAPIAKDYFTGNVRIATTAPKDSPHDVPVVASPAGGVIVLTTAPLLDFAHRSVLGGPSTKGLGLQNFGNLPVTISGGVAAPFTAPSPITLAPGATASLAVQHDPRFEDVGADLSESVTLAAQDPVCAPLPANVQVAVHTYELAVHATTGKPVGLPNERHSCAVGSSGHAYCWGGNGSGQLGTNGGPPSARPRLVSNLTNAVYIDAGYATTCAIVAGGAVWCWGKGLSGQLGNGIATTSPVPVQVQGIADATKIVVDMNHVCALRQSGPVACWGSSGLLGDGSPFAPGILSPVAVQGVTDAVDIDAMWAQTCIARQNGTVACWGWDRDTYFAGSGVNYTTTPIQIAGASGALEVAVPLGGGCYLSSQGLYSWGNHPDGTFSTGPQLEYWGALSRLSTRSLNRCSIQGGSHVFCYGTNTSGVLGTGGEQPWGGVVRSGTAVWVGFDNTLAIDAGTLWIWGKPWGSSTIVSPQPVPGFDP